jgi:hypothetical protein
VYIMQVELKARCVESVDDTQRVGQSIKHKMEGGRTLLLLGFPTVLTLPHRR